MKKSGTGSGGGLGSRNVKEVPVRVGQKPTGVNPAAVAQTERFESQSPTPVAADVFFERDGASDGIVVVRFGVDMPDGRSAAREFGLGILPAHRIFH